MNMTETKPASQVEAAQAEYARRAKATELAQAGEAKVKLTIRQLNQQHAAMNDEMRTGYIELDRKTLAGAIDLKLLAEHANLRTLISAILDQRDRLYSVYAPVATLARLQAEAEELEALSRVRRLEGEEQKGKRDRLLESVAELEGDVRISDDIGLSADLLNQSARLLLDARGKRAEVLELQNKLQRGAAQ